MEIYPFQDGIISSICSLSRSLLLPNVKLGKMSFLLSFVSVAFITCSVSYIPCPLLAVANRGHRFIMTSSVELFKISKENLEILLFRFWLNPLYPSCISVN